MVWERSEADHLKNKKMHSCFTGIAQWRTNGNTEGSTRVPSMNSGSSSWHVFLFKSGRESACLGEDTWQIIQSPI
jgi:hypothetical protein